MFAKTIKRILYFFVGIFVLLNIMAAFHAYKFTHFYAGIPKAKKPEEMTGLEKTSAIFFGNKFSKSKVVDSFSVAHQTIGLTTNDSMHLESWYAKADSNAKGTILLFHGHGSSKSGIIAEATAFHKMGWNVLLTDFRAHGNSEGEVCTIGANEAKDVKAAFDYTRALGEKNIVLYGISLGASTILTAVDHEGIKPEKVILEMPFGTLVDGVKGRLRMMKVPEQPMSTLLAFWGGVEQGFWAFDHRPQDFASKLNCPVLLQWGLNDPRVTQDETNAIFKNLASHDKLLMVYARSGHQSLLKNEHEKWMSTVGKFLN
ncbi:MAG: alpha/beta hydrolase [Chitinophagaceae bacterium BSSC1]|nr:MAG: alpha/beta hydrolase [Chitinophagaceae bacterium BSSC1]